jgi:hypothetical protein
MENSELQKEKDAFQSMVSNSAYEYSKKYSSDRETIEKAFETGAYFMQEIVRKKDSATIVRLSMENKDLKEKGNGKILAEKIDQYVELVSKLDDKISDLEFQKQELNKQLTQKDIVIDKYIGKLHQIRAVAEKI